METWLNYLAAFVIFVMALQRAALPRNVKELWFVAAAIACTYYSFFAGERHSEIFLSYAVFCLAHYVILMYGSTPQNDWIFPFAIISPLVCLFLVKAEGAFAYAGLSYMAFRLSYLSHEMHIGRVALPAFERYLGFVFFPPTFLIGPISPYKLFHESMEAAGGLVAPYSRCLGRILVGIIKCYLLAVMFKAVSFELYWQPFYYHHFLDFTVTAVSTALYIYFNFSGACDIMIGAAGLMGIRVSENFNNPFLSRNLVEFWTRNHMTMTQLARDIFFTPLQLYCARATRGRAMWLITPAITIATFVLIGVWHGDQAGYALFGLMHGVGVVAVNAYLSLSRRFPPRVRQKLESRPARLASIFLTFMYVSYSTVFFGADWEQISKIFFQLRFS